MNMQSVDMTACVCVCEWNSHMNMQSVDVTACVCM